MKTKENYWDIVSFLSNIRYNIFYGFGNLIKWLPIIWRDRDFDHTFLMKIIRVKLENMEKLHKYHGHSVNSERYADDLRMCSELANKIESEDYLEESLGKYRYLIDKREMTNWVDNSNRLHFRSNLSELEENIYMDALKNQEEYLNRDIHLLFEAIKRHYLEWWD